MKDCITKKTVYLIRHGESTFNATNRQDVDCNLTDLGRKQAKKLGERLKDIHFDFVIISPLARAQQTFENSKINHKALETNYLCREYKETKSDFLIGEDFRQETDEELTQRCMNFIEYMKTLDYSLIGVVCHSTFIYYSLDILLGRGQWLDNADFSIIYL